MSNRLYVLLCLSWQAAQLKGEVLCGSQEALGSKRKDRTRVVYLYGIWVQFAFWAAG